MTRYIIKNNLPKGTLQATGGMNRNDAAQSFIRAAYYLETFGYQTKMVFRNEKGKDLRGTIQVEIDGFYYYVELYKQK